MNILIFHSNTHLPYVLHFVLEPGGIDPKKDVVTFDEVRDAAEESLLAAVQGHELAKGNPKGLKAVGNALLFHDGVLKQGLNEVAGRYAVAVLQGVDPERDPSYKYSAARNSLLSEAEKMLQRFHPDSQKAGDINSVIEMAGSSPMVIRFNREMEKIPFPNRAQGAAR